MTEPSMARELEQALAEIPVLDIHTHLVGGNLGARGLHDILLYHMVVSDLYAAGFLFGYTRGSDYLTCGLYGARAAAEIISHYGARPEKLLKEVVVG